VVSRASLNTVSGSLSSRYAYVDLYSITLNV